MAEYLLDHLDRQDSGAVTLGYEFYRMAGEENPSIRKLLEEWGEGAAGKDTEGQSESPDVEKQEERKPERFCGETVERSGSGMVRYRESLPENRLAENFPEWVDTASAAPPAWLMCGNPGCFCEARARLTRIFVSRRKASLWVRKKTP